MQRDFTGELIGSRVGAGDSGLLTVQGATIKLKWKSLPRKDKNFVYIRNEFESSQTCNPKEGLEVEGIWMIKNPKACEKMRNSLKILRESREYNRKALKILFHGTAVQAIEKILRTEFRVDFKGRKGMMGAGIYFAPDPCKAYRYSRGETLNILRCVVYLADDHDYAYPFDGRHKNTVFDEYVIRHSEHVLVTHIIRCRKVRRRLGGSKGGVFTGGVDASEYDRRIIWGGWVKEAGKDLDFDFSFVFRDNNKKEEGRKRVHYESFIPVLRDEKKKEMLKMNIHREKVKRQKAQEERNTTPEQLKRSLFRNLRGDQDIDLVFLVDCTVSMQKSIDDVIESIPKITNFLQKVFSRVTLRMGFLGYRDITDFTQFLMCPLTSPEDAKKWIEKKNKEADGLAKGGGSTPEDIHGALYKLIKKMNWERPTRVCIHICDSPPHGVQYHDSKNLRDPFPKGMFGYGDEDGFIEEDDEEYNPYQYTMREILGEMNRKYRILYNIVQVPFGMEREIITHRMVKKFREYYDTKERKLEVFSDPSTTFHEVIRSVVIRNRKRTLSKHRSIISTSTKRRSSEPFNIEFKVEKKEEMRKWCPYQKVVTLTLYKGLLRDSRKVFIALNPGVRNLAIENQPFEKGSSRYFFRVIDVESEKMYVGKILRRDVNNNFFGGDEKKILRAYKYEILARDFCRKLSDSFTSDMSELRRRIGSRKDLNLSFADIEFVRPHEIIKIGNPKTIFMTIEPYLTRTVKFEKFNGKFGNGSEEEYRHHRIPQAFSHYTYEKTRRKFLVCDLQGVDEEINGKIYRFTDATIHSVDIELWNVYGGRKKGGRKYEEFEFTSNYGKEGIRSFFMSHRCNRVCKLLGLKPLRFV